MNQTKLNSAALTQGPSRAPARAMLKAVGFTDEDLRRPLIGVANTWIEIGPCNHHLRELAASVKQGIRSAGGTPMEFNTVSISDGITMGTEGMRTSLVSREVIADSIELVARGNQFDGIVALVGCDKTIPGAIMALARLNLPGLVLYGGSIAPGSFHGKDVTIQDVFEAVGAHAQKRINDADLLALENSACPGAGACGGQFTANTMAMVCEFLGLSLMGSASVPALDASKPEVAQAAGAKVMDLLKHDLRPRQILTREAFENAIASVAATGGSTNAVLHLLAIANEAGVALSSMISIVFLSECLCWLILSLGEDLSLLICITPAAPDWSRSGLMKQDYCTEARSPSAARASPRRRKPRTKHAEQEVVRPLGRPIKPTGGLVILKGNLAPEGCVVKVAGHQQVHHRGPARVFDSEEAAFAAVQAGRIQSRGCAGHPLRRPAWWTWHARDAGRDGSIGRRRFG